MSRRTRLTMVLALAWCAALSGTAAAQQAPPPGSAGREGSTLVIRNDGRENDAKAFYIANGAFYPGHLWMGNRRVESGESYYYEPAYGPGCELDREGPIEFGGVRCPLNGVTEIVIDMAAGASDGLTLMVSGAAPPVRVLGGDLDAMRTFGVVEGYAPASPAMTALIHEPSATGGDSSAMFSPGQLPRFEVAAADGMQSVRAWGVTDVRVATGGGDDIVVIENAADAVGVDAGEGDDQVWVDTRAGATSAIDGGSGHDVLRSHDRVPTTITCGAGTDTIHVNTADRAGSGCAQPVVGLEPYTGFASCVDLTASVCDFARAQRGATGSVDGRRLTIKGVGRLKRRGVVWARVATENRLYGSGALASTPGSGVRHDAGALKLRLRVTRAGRRALKPSRKGLRLILGTKSGRDLSSIIVDLDGIAFKVKR